MNIQELLRVMNCGAPLTAGAARTKVILHTEDGEVEIKGAVFSVDRVILTAATDVFTGRDE